MTRNSQPSKPMTFTIEPVSTMPTAKRITGWHEPLRIAILNLPPGSAIFVQADADQPLPVLQNTLASNHTGEGVRTRRDHDRHGVWVYKADRDVPQT